MTKYLVQFEINIADTDAPPSDWLPYSLDQLLERGESVENFNCSEVK
jgi:hypothetical protein